MSKKIYLYGNWKMNMTVAETKKFFDEFAGIYKPASDLEVGVFSPFTSLWALADGAKKHGVVFGAQNVYFEPKGAFTGEVSIPMLAEIGVNHVILGHSERRHIFGESDEMIAKKTKAVLDAGMIPVLCYGETLEEREAGNTFKVMERQLKSALNGLKPKEVAKIIYAYEPVWAIGTGKSATSAQAQEVCEWSRKLIADPKVVILYGGSVKGSNAKELLSMKDIDGALVGGASLKPASFLEIYTAYKN
ncbi:MAG: triose-phosphate isomerase [Synergistales bacterium]|nr:triose-phosphate isomerase [Synergistales bacterium]MDY6400709.1 triose-phosphate isomerase [Synergistales bacterium]MDY6404835.1 triose-phosphate isomerase [Synergistales bacterium]MDY6410085.1 triose-phosphate isomerase [Synergistales bacterium]MDY6413815.1 triose-phosphate isomerase [Synergistales bacterium]